MLLLQSKKRLFLNLIKVFRYSKTNLKIILKKILNRAKNFKLSYFEIFLFKNFFYSFIKTNLLIFKQQYFVC